jgi:hypothetical protein
MYSAVTVLLTLLGLYLIAIGSYWWALLVLCLAISITGTLVIGFFVIFTFFLWAFV